MELASSLALTSGLPGRDVLYLPELVAISILTFSDQQCGRSFQQWVDEFVYCMGAELDFERAPLAKPDTLVLSLICLPPAMGGFRTGTSHKRSESEYWSTFKVDHASFISTDVERSVNAIKDGLIGAIAQVPLSRVPSVLKESFMQAAETAARSLIANPSRHPRRPKLEAS